MAIVCCRLCFEPGVAYYHHDIKEVYERSVNTTGECQRRWRETTKCYHLTFGSKQKYCYLKDKSPLQARRKRLAGLVSGPNDCGEFGHVAPEQISGRRQRLY